MASISFSRASNLLSILERNPKRLGRIKFLGELFKAGGFELRIAGGAVRDMLGGKEPQDIDFATTAKPEESLRLLEPHTDVLRIIVTTAGQKHGTVAVKFKQAELDMKRIKLVYDGATDSNSVNKRSDIKIEYDDESPFEITTLRCDKFTDGRHAEVVFVNDWKIDAERRDLTMNAMFLTLDKGELVDFFNGESDLNSGIVRFVGDPDKRVKEDYLRILRFFRFWSRYGIKNKPDATTSRTLRDNLEGLDIISGERIWQELKKIFGCLPCAEVVDLMLEFRVFNQIHFTDKEAEDYSNYSKFVHEEMRKVQSNIFDFTQKHSDATPVNQRRKMNEILPAIQSVACIETAQMCLAACKRLKFSNNERDAMLYIIENRSARNPELKYLRRQLTRAHTSEVPQLLCRIRALLIYIGEFDLMRGLESWEIPSFPLTGDMIAKEVKKRNLDRKIIKVMMEELRDDWADTDYTLNENSLIGLMCEKLDRRTCG